MGGNDILLDRVIPPEELLQQLVILLGVRPDDIYIPGHTPDEVFADRGYAQVVAKIIKYGPGFPMGLFIATDSSLPDPAEPALIQALCRQLQCRALIEPLAPPKDQGKDTIYWLVTPDSQLYRVVLEDMPLDEDPPRFIIDTSYDMQPVVWPAHK